MANTSSMILKSVCKGSDYCLIKRKYAEYRKCYVALVREQLANIQKGKQCGLCRKCVDVFADQKEDQCPHSLGPTNHGLLQCWDQPFHTFMQLLELVKKRVEEEETGNL